MIFLDFDRTLFDTDSFYTYKRVAAHPAPQGMKLSAYWDSLVVSGALSFTDGELAQFVFPDVTPFLDRCRIEGATLITFGDPALKRAVVRSCGLGGLFTERFFTGDIRKGLYLKEKLGGDVAGVLIDDTQIELDLVAAHCPHLTLFEMRRDGKDGSGAYPVIHSLSELEGSMVK